METRSGDAPGVDETAGWGETGCGALQLLLDAGVGNDAALGSECRIQSGADSSWHAGAMDNEPELLLEEVAGSDALPAQGGGES